MVGLFRILLFLMELFPLKINLLRYDIIFFWAVCDAVDQGFDFLNQFDGNPSAFIQTLDFPLRLSIEIVILSDDLPVVFQHLFFIF